MFESRSPLKGHRVRKYRYQQQASAFSSQDSGEREPLPPLLSSTLMVLLLETQDWLEDEILFGMTKEIGLKGMPELLELPPVWQRNCGP